MKKLRYYLYEKRFAGDLTAYGLSALIAVFVSISFIEITKAILGNKNIKPD